MKKLFISIVLTLISLFAYAIPGGCYSGESRAHRDRCAIQISNNTLNVINREGDVIARWSIVKDENGKLTLKSALGATANATWWEEDGKIYLRWNYELYTRME
ncbi:MAG: hypothetical protein IJ064_06860 [Bacteroidaceae bacterium]|nr:hypothetical protein [Bacteroidaceae bacterium]